MATLLLAEDDPDNALLATVVCERAGHRVTVCTDGREVLERLAAAPIDLLILDILLPGLDGIALTRELRGDPRFAHLPILGLTALVDARPEAQAAGMDLVLTKPYRGAELREALTRLLGDATT